MSQKEWDRLKVIEQLDQGLIGQQQAANWLGLSMRQVRRTLRHYQCQGDHGLVHQGRGKPAKGYIQGEAARQMRHVKGG